MAIPANACLSVTSTGRGAGKTVHGILRETPSISSKIVSRFWIKAAKNDNGTVKSWYLYENDQIIGQKPTYDEATYLLHQVALAVRRREQQKRLQQ